MMQTTPASRLGQIIDNIAAGCDKQDINIVRIIR